MIENVRHERRMWECSAARAKPVLNVSHPLVEYVIAHKDDKDNKNEALICEQLYDLAKLQQGPLDAEAMTKFVNRSNDIMVALTK